MSPGSVDDFFGDVTTSARQAKGNTMWCLHEVRSYTPERYTHPPPTLTPAASPASLGPLEPLRFWFPNISGVQLKTSRR